MRLEIEFAFLAGWARQFMKSAAIAVSLALAGCQTSKPVDESGIDAEPYTAPWCAAGMRFANERPDAAWAAGRCCENGYAGLARDKEKAIDYYLQAARAGEIRAADDLRRLGVSVPADRPRRAEVGMNSRDTEYQHLLTAIPLPGQQPGPP